MLFARSNPPGRHRAFTLVEVLVVISVIAISLVAIVPAFGRIIDSANYSAAVNRVTAALALARSEAMNGTQTAVAFLFDPQTERTTLLVVERVRNAGSLTRDPEDACNQTAFVFTPVPGQAAIVLPKGFGVYGLALSASRPLPCENLELGWYRNEAVRRSSSNPDVTDRFWIFPRNDARIFIDNDLWPEIEDDPDLSEWREASRFAETFFVRFDEKGAILPSVELGTGANLLNAYLEFDAPSDLVDVTVNLFESPTLFDPEEFEFEDNRAGGVKYAANREAQIRSVDLLAIVDLTRLADETGIASPWFVVPQSEISLDGTDSVPNLLTPTDPKRAFIDGDFASDTDMPTDSPESFIHRISRWIDANAEVISFNRSTGEAMRRGSQ
jgi:prepilin-type N-terminal cleavage/methylation domain-containing protein